MAQLITIKRRLKRAIRNAESAEDLADSLLELLDGASEADLEQAATTIAQTIWDAQGGSEYEDAA